MERFEISDDEFNYIIINNKTGLDCLIVPKEAYKDPKSAVDGFKEIMEISANGKGNWRNSHGK